MATMDVYDVIGTALAAITGLCHGKKRHNELAEAVTTLVTSLRRGTFVVACTKANAQTVLEASSSSGANVLSTPGGQPEQVTAQFLDPAKVEEILKPTRLALRSKSPKIAEASLQIVQTLIARGLVRGDADAPPGTANGVDDTVEDRGSNPSGVNSEGAEDASEGPEGVSDDATVASSPRATPSSSFPAETERDALVRNTQACEMIDLICGVGVVPDEAVELQMLKCLLTAVSSHSLRVRSKALLRVTRACVNCYLGSASEVVQTTAKASLTQMLVVVFHRLESNGETNTSVAPVIRVSDVFSSQARWPVTVDQAIVQYTRWDTTLTTCRYQSQSFKKSTRGAKTSRAATAAAAAFRKTDDDAFAATAVANFVQGFMDKVASDLTSVAVSVGASSDDTDQTDLGWVPAARGAETVRHVTDTEFDGAEDDATPGKSVNVSDGRVNHIQDSTRVNQTDDWTTKTPENLSSLESHLEEGDVFLVFRALCKLAAKPGDLLNPAVARGKILSLELLRILLENAGPRFRSSTRLTSAVSEYLCDAVVVCASQETLPAAHGLALCAFCAVVKNFRPSLKAEIGVFFPALLLEPLVKRGVCETNPQSASGTASSYHFSYQRKCVLLQCARELLTDVTVLADMFVNYDCNMDSQNLFEKFVDTLAFVARWGCGEGSGAGGGAGGASVGSNAAMPAVHSPTAVSLTLEEQRMCASLRLEALELLRALVETLREWVDSTHGTATESHGVGANAAIDSVTPTHGAIDLQKKLDQERERDGSSNPNLVEIQKAKLTKTAYQHAIALFNTNPKKGLVVLQQLNKCGPSASEIAVFLKHTPDLDKTSVGDFLGERDDGAIAVMHAYVDGMDFSGYKLDEAIRVFLAGFRLPGESQKIDRLMEKFAQRFCLQNPGMYRSPDTAYVLSFSTIMLNTDAHNPGVKHKMTKEGFVKNNRGIDDGGDVAAEHLEALYDRIVQNEIIMKDSDTKALAEKAEINASKNGSLGGGMQKTLKDMSNRLGVDLFTSLMTKPRVVHDVDTSVFMATVRERAARDAASGSWHTVHDPLCAKPMFDAFKDGVLRAFDTAWRGNGADSREKDPALQEANSEIVTAVLTGYVSIAQLAASANAFTSLDEIVQALTEMAAPKPPAAYKPRNVLALRFLVEFVSARQPGGRDKTARDSGNALTELNWAKVLATASRYDFIFSASAGFDESVLFASLGANGGATCAANPPGGHRSVKAAAEKFSSPFGKTSGPVFGNMFGGSGMGLMFGGTAAAAAGTTDESPFAHLRKGQVHATDAAATTPSIRGSVSEEERVQEKHAPDAFDDLTLRDFVDPGFEVLKTFTPDDLDVLYHASVSLDGDAVVRFTKALCRVSLGELSSPSPRVFSLTKLVEVASLNSARVRFVWVKMWCVMAEFFVKAGCHADVNVAMYAVDSLRQLAVKFLADRKELKLYSFQNDFMKPFVEVMKASRNPEIREFLVRCVSQIITTQAGNVRSGWRSVFAVFTAAASDANLEISRMAFEIVERVIREHFAHITETDPSTFVECVTCLIAFTGVTDPVEEHFGGVGNEKGNGGASAVSKNRNRATKKTDPSSSAAVISLNAIAFLRFCALKLADGEVGDLEISKGGVGDGEYDFGVGDTDTGDVPDENRPQSAIQSLKSIPTAQRKSKGKGKGVTAFTDRETHVYFWFPLLHGLSTLAHDDRREIRGAALQVLFDILNFHGQHFSPGFWCRVFHEILLPVFDGGRAKELSNDLSNDSTPQDGSDNDQVLTPQDGSDHDQDRWLFQTCQHCLDGVVDLFAKFYPSVATKAGEEGAGVLRKLTALLASLASRPHAELAACGVGAMHRLTGGAGSEFDWNAWRVVVKGGLVDALLRTTTSLRLFAHRDSAPLDIAPRAFQSKAATARLLTNALAETYFRHGDCLDFETLTCLVDALVSVAKHAKQAAGEAGAGNNNTHRTDDSFMTCLAVETEARRATLAVLLHLHASGRSDSDGVGGTAVVSVVVSSPAQVKCGVATRTKLVELVVAILTYRFADQSRDDRREPDVNAETDAAVKRRYDGNKERALAPLVADALRALARLDDESFRDALFSKSYGQTPSLRVTTGYDALVALVGSASTPPETRAALCDVFQRRVAPLAARAASGNGVKLGVTD